MQQLFTCNLHPRTTEVFLLDSIGEFVDLRQGMDERTLWICDTHTEQFIPQSIQPVVLEPGESAKHWEGIESILKKALERGIARDGRFIAVGGGVVCDMGAFAASIYMRGCAVSLVPTTLLAMVDASLGGKTAIDLFGSKNLVGTFHPATDLYICPQTLATLDEQGYRNGLGEVLKHGLLASDDRLTCFLESERDAILARDPVSLGRMITESLRVKQSYIESDPTETRGIRNALNLGHTFAHALESVGNLSRWSHGEAVAWGMVKALHAGVATGVTPLLVAQRYQRLLGSYGFDTSYRVEDVEAFMLALRTDKKKQGSQIRFVLMEDQGRHISTPLEPDVVRRVIIE